MKKRTKQVSNIYNLARIEASEFNEGFASREGVAYETGIDRTRLARIENDTVTPYPDEIVMLADVYNAPQLLTYHCAEQCPIGKAIGVKAVKGLSISQIAVKLSNALRELEDGEELLKIAEDGKISNKDEEIQVEDILQILSKIGAIYHELTTFVRREMTNKCIKK